MEVIIVNIEILTLRDFQQGARAVNVALPVLAIECEVTPPIENHLDAYEDAVLRLVSIGLSARGIAGTMNATESLIEEILDNLERKRYVEKEIGKPWKITDDGNKYLCDAIGERESDNSQFGYMFVNAIRKDVLPFFYQGDINRIALFRGKELPAKLTKCGDEGKTFEPFTPKRAKLRESYRNYLKKLDTLDQYDDGDLTFDEAIDLFEDLDYFDEESDDFATLEDRQYQTGARIPKRGSRRHQCTQLVAGISARGCQYYIGEIRRPRRAYIGIGRYQHTLRRSDIGAAP